MERKIVWSDTALDNLDRITEYLKLNWGNKVLDKFHSKLYSKINLLLLHPDLGSKTAKYSLYRNFLITKKYLLIYRYDKEELIIIRIKHSSQNK